MKVEVSRRQHPIWDNWFRIKEKLPYYDRPLVGRWQYIYESEKGKISLIELPNYFHDGVTLWEIYCLEGDVFEDIERFGSKEEAEKRIFELLDEAKD